MPEVASRHHVEEITICMEEALKAAGIVAAELSGVAVTKGPGLVGALLIGISAAKAFAWANELPLIPVNHMAGHIYAANFVEKLSFPLMALLVSGGHTELVYMKADGCFEIIGETRDDAAGEAYDKIGRVLGLSYPSGKELDEMAHLGKDTFGFPRGMIKEDNYDFSFSGLKSSVINLYHNAEQRGEELDKFDLAASFQQSVIDVLVTKTLRACQEYPVKQLVVAGGVAANQGLRSQLKSAVAASLPEMHVVVPPLKLCGDNGAMIAFAGYQRLKAGEQDGLSVTTTPRWPMTELTNPELV